MKSNDPEIKEVPTLTEFCRSEKRAAHLLEEWYTQRNQILRYPGLSSGEVTMENIPITEKLVVWWKCKNGHAWQDTVAERVKNVIDGSDRGCIFCQKETISREKYLYDYCSAPVPVGEIDVSHLLAEWDSEKNGSLTPKDVRTVAYIKVWWKCSRGHSWQALVANRVKAGVGCPYCGNKQVLAGFNDFASRFPAIAAEWDTEKNQCLPDTVSAMSNRRVWWRCSRGHSYEKMISNRTQQGQGCSLCAAMDGKKGSMRIVGYNDFATTHPHLLSEWNYEKNGALKPTDLKAGSRRSVWWICPAGHEWETPLSRRTGKRKIGCPFCAGKYKI